MKLINLLALLIVVALVGVGCSASRSVAYLQDSKEYNYDSLSMSVHEAMIMPHDVLSITVNTSDPSASTPFNLFKPTVGSTSSANTQILTYTVDKRGEIDYPTLGALKVGGLTLSDAEELIRTKLQPYLKEIPVVTILIDNFTVSVLGSVSKPGHMTISDNKVTILEAIAMAGDLTIYGQRPDIKIVREDVNGKRTVVEMDINSTDIIYSPYYYLQQNDVVYVTPNKAFSKSAGISSGTTIWFSIISTLMSITTFVIMLISL